MRGRRAAGFKNIGKSLMCRDRPVAQSDVVAIPAITEPSMTHKRSRAGIMIGLAAATGAFGAATAMSAAPTAGAQPADIYPEIIQALDTNFADGQASLQEALALLPGGLANHDSLEEAQGLFNLFVAADDNGVLAPENVLLGLVDALGNDPYSPLLALPMDLPTNYAEGLADAQLFISSAASEFTAASAAFSLGDYGQAALLDVLGANSLTIYPLQELLVGAVAGLTL